MRDANPTASSRARRLHRNATGAERRHQFRAPQIDAATFVRQDPIGPCLDDFICRERRLVVEADAGQHATDKRIAAREQWLSDRRYRVVRFWNNDVLANTDGVPESIAAALKRSASIASNTAGAQDRNDAPSPRPFRRTRRTWGEGSLAP